MNIQEAAAELLQAARSWVSTGPALENVRTRALAIGNAATDPQDPRAQAAFRVAVLARRAYADWAELDGKWAAIARVIPWIRPATEPTLGAVPLVPVFIASAVISLAVAVRSIFRRRTALETLAELLERGELTVDQAGELMETAAEDSEAEGEGGFLLPVMALGALAVVLMVARK